MRLVVARCVDAYYRCAGGYVYVHRAEPAYTFDVLPVRVDAFLFVCVNLCVRPRTCVCLRLRVYKLRDAYEG